MAHNASVIGNCGVCGDALPVGANHAFTVCSHLFCISCLLKWHKANPMATCPMCRAKLCSSDDENDVSSNQLSDSENMTDEPDSDGETFEASIHAYEIAETNRILTQMNMSMHEEIMHDHIMEVIEIHAMNYCHVNLFGYMGRINLHTITKEESNHYYERIETGTITPNSYYIIELMHTPESTNWSRYRFGRIEEIISHHLLPDSKWYAFRERIDRIDEERGQLTTEWANEIQHIALDNVKVLRHYFPKIRAYARPTNLFA